MLLIVATFAFACDEPVFSSLPVPAAPADGKGVVTGDGVLDGREVVGVRFSMHSAEPVDVWKRVLGTPERQDDWVPDRFGYDLVEKLDASHMYLRINVGLIFGAVHVRRQLVAHVQDYQREGTYVTCWKMVDHVPYAAQLARLANDADWENTSAGWWSVTPEGAGSFVGYQWWAVAGKVPVPIMKFGASQTLPDLMDAFEAHAQELGRGS